MGEQIRALVLHTDEVQVMGLKEALETQFVCTERARNCKESRKSLAGTSPPHLLFTDIDLPDGTWADVLDMAAIALQPVSVIVVSPVADGPLYMDVMERRAYDFITHSFTAPEINHILIAAVQSIVRQRKEHVRPRGENRRDAFRTGSAAFNKT